jgi:hypothetical protein
MKIIKNIINKIWLYKKYKNDEFHKSLDFDIDKYSKMNEVEKKDYSMKLIKERNKAHEIDNKNIFRGL